MSLLAGLTAYYQMDGNSNDLIGTNNGTDSSVTYVAGKINQAASYTHSLTTFAPVLNASMGSFSIWIYPNTLSTNNRIYSDQAGYFYAEYEETVPNKVNIALYNSAISSVSITIVAGSWNHLVVTWNSSGYNVYLNSVFQGAVNATTLLNTTFQFNLGGFIGAPTAYRYKGLLDEVGFWNRELLSSEIVKLYNYGNGLTYPFKYNPSNFFSFFQ